MKKISEHLGQIIVALAGVALLVAALVVFKAPIGEFYHSIVDKETSVADNVLSSIEDIDLVNLGGETPEPTPGPVVEISFNLNYEGATGTLDAVQIIEGAGYGQLPAPTREGYTFGGWYTNAACSGDAVTADTTVSATHTLFAQWIASPTPGPGKDPALNPDDGTAPANGTTYKYGDYVYTYQTASSGWKVAINTAVTDKNQTAYGPILESVNGEPITDLNSTFYKCTNLTTAPVIPSSVTNMSYTFMECTKLTTAPAIPAGVTNMSYTFYKCTGLTDVSDLVIPSSVTNMSDTFYNCKSLTTAPAIPSGVTNMANTFSGCTSLKTYVGAPEGTADGDFSGYVIPDGVTNMSSAFNKCTNLTTAPAIPESVTNLRSTFNGCNNLPEAPEIPAGVTNMTETFYYCTSLTDVSNLVIPSSVTNMSGTFAFCTGLTDVSDLAIPSSVTNMSRTFEGCSSLITAPVIPSSVTNMANTFSRCTNLTTAPAIPAGVTDMGFTFNGCTSLKTYVGSTAPDGDFSAYAIPSGVTNMASTFPGCTNLVKAPVIPSSVTNMTDTFYGCTNLVKAPVIPSSVTYMGFTFYGCTSLTGTITINANTTTYSGCFENTTQPITLTGSSTVLAELAATATNSNVTVQQ